jgi:phosphopantetheine--protein transferase-like protein
MSLGVDVLTVGELDRLLIRDWFRRYAYTDTELDEAASFESSRGREFLAGRFAAKEAIGKALGTGWSGGIRPCHIGVPRAADGAPTVELTGPAARRAHERGLESVRVSITHKRGLVVAVALAVAPADAGGPVRAIAAVGGRGDEAVMSDDETAEVTEPAETAEPGEPTVMLRARMGGADGHYGGGLVDGARILRLFGDLATEITIRLDGDEGLLSEYTGVRFTAPVYVGDYVEAEARLVRRGPLRRTIDFTARKVIAARPDLGPSRAEPLDPPVVVCRARGIAVRPHPYVGTLRGAIGNGAV